LYRTEAQRIAAEASQHAYQQVLTAVGHDKITTEITEAGEFYFAEDYHQQYLSAGKNPNGYCGIGGTGVQLGDSTSWCPTGIAPTDG
jgi:peptide-methionine (S)-S-oxide reductase